MASSSGSKAFSSFAPSFPDPPLTSTPKPLSYDVFLSFRGLDTRNNFTGHLYDRLVMAGLHTFMDDPELRKGKEISLELMTAIEESRIYIVVFSENYASSKWCLDELVKIMQCHEGGKLIRGKVVLPVFYGVEPSDVRGQKGSFEEAFRNHEAIYFSQLDKVEGWRFALCKAANLSGFDLQRSPLRSESRLISMIVEEVLAQVKPKKLFVAKYPVGLDSRVNEVYSMLRLGYDYHVRIIGIWGMGGSGKTVVAKALYNKLLQLFDSSCFLENVRSEVSERRNGLVNLQETLLNELLMTKNANHIGSVSIGIEMIRERLCRKKVLIVLDDLDKASQVDALAGHCDWFGRGSIIIITTRDHHLLNQVKAYGIYEAKELNREESLELFNRQSFEDGLPPEPYAVIADQIISYSCGLPLALVVLGAYLFGKTIQQWKSAFENLQQIPLTDIQKILQISYEGLDYREREIFLDIACFFIGMDIDYVTEILNGCGFKSEIGIGILTDRCLLTVSRKNELRMHDLLRDMGREIVRQQFPRKPGKRTRLWNHQDATKVLTRNKGTGAIEGVSLVSPIVEILLDTKKFARMHDLRLLEMDNVDLDGSFEHLSDEIRWISWQNCSLKHLPSNLQMGNLVALDMQHSKMSTVWHYNQLIKDLKIINLSHSKCLTSTPDFRRIPNLVTLILEGCTSLLQIDPSIGCLDSLLVLNLKGCEKIRYIPSEICSLRLLGYLNLSGCSNLRELPNELGSIESLRELYADETAITKLPLTFSRLVNLTSLSLRGCTKISSKANWTSEVDLSCLTSLKSLRRLYLRDCNLSDEDIPSDIGFYSELQELDLAGNSLNKLPSSFRMLTNLGSLWLDNWSILHSMSGLPPNIMALVTKNITTPRGRGNVEAIDDIEIQFFICFMFLFILVCVL